MAAANEAVFAAAGAQGSQPSENQRGHGDMAEPQRPRPMWEAHGPRTQPTIIPQAALDRSAAGPASLAPEPLHVGTAARVLGGAMMEELRSQSSAFAGGHVQVAQGEVVEARAEGLRSAGSGGAWPSGGEEGRDDGFGAASSTASREGARLLARLNPGSMGHPFLCGRPCLYALMGCANGPTCEFCHIPHDTPPRQLDKQRRSVLRSMPLEEAQALMIPIIWQKVVEITTDATTILALNRLVAACVVERPAEQPLVPRENRRLYAGLRGMTPRHLLAVFMDIMRRHEAHGPTWAAEALLDHLLLPFGVRSL